MYYHNTYHQHEVPPLIMTQRILKLFHPRNKSMKLVRRPSNLLSVTVFSPEESGYEIDYVV